MNDTEVRVEYAPKPSDSYRVTLWCWPNMVRWVSLLVVLLAIGPIESWWSPVWSTPELRSQVLALLVLASPIFLVWLVYPYISIWYVFRKYPVIRMRRCATISARGARRVGGLQHRLQVDAFLADYRNFRGIRIRPDANSHCVYSEALFERSDRSGHTAPRDSRKLPK